MHILLAATLLLSAPHGTVYHDRNANGRRDTGEPGIAGVVVSNQDTVVRTDASGAYAMTGSGVGIVHVSLPDGWRAAGPFWFPVPASTDAALDFGLVTSRRTDTFTFVHASDTHISAASAARTDRLRALVDSLRPAFVLVSGDLVRDALRVGEAEATGYYQLFNEKVGAFPVPTYTVPGNHEIFGIETDKSKVSAEHPLFGRAMYRRYRGPDYYSFNVGGVHVVALNSVDISDQWYYGHIDSLQLAWLERDLAMVPPTTPVVTFNHIPFFSSSESVQGYKDGPPAPSLITVRGKTQYRHTVSNASEVLALLSGRAYPLALSGHGHMVERIRFAGVATRFDQVSAVVGASSGAGMTFPSGVTLYRVRRGSIGEGTFIPLGIDTTAR
jgi:predicted MPP superfamily phosphohydrolase